MNTLNMLFSFMTVSLESFSDVAEVFFQGFFDIFDASCPFFVLSFHKIPDDEAFIVNKSCNSGITSLSFINVLGDHI